MMDSLLCNHGLKTDNPGKSTDQTTSSTSDSSCVRPHRHIEKSILTRTVE